LAERLDGVSDGPYAGTHFSRTELRELQYAALLHDFGKIGVREQVLVKAKKLYPHELQAIRDRVAYAIKCVEADVLSRKVAALSGGSAQPEALAALDLELTARKTALLDALKTISQANEPTVLAEGDFTRIADIFGMQVHDGIESFRLLNDAELLALQVPRGSLAPSEFDEIRSHVVHTFNFLSQIPWGKNMARIPAIAGSHHERLNGTGYPHGLSAESIPLPSKIMSIADIYDALTARDRPYKRAVPVEKALDILDTEVRDGHIDGALVKLFRDAKIYLLGERSLKY
jgi:HD-GYP domain-containing protein (c-di-GMP phosphodiesterase class II)